MCSLILAVLALPAAAIASSRSTKDLKSYLAAARAARKGVDPLKPAMNSAEQAFLDKANACPGVIASMESLPKGARDTAVSQLGFDLLSWVIAARAAAGAAPLATFDARLEKLGGSPDRALATYATSQLAGYRWLVAGPTNPDVCADMSAWAGSGFQTFTDEELAVQAWLVRGGVALVGNDAAERRFKADLRRHHLKRGKEEARLMNELLPERRIDGDLTLMILTLTTP